MTAIGFGLAVGAYWVGMFGYCLVRGYDVTFTQMARSTWPAGAPGTGGGGTSGQGAAGATQPKQPLGGDGAVGGFIAGLIPGL